MTCIIALIRDEIAYIAGDKCATQGVSESLIKNKKVFNKHGVLIGSCGSFRIINILQALDIRQVLLNSRGVENFAFDFSNYLLNTCEEHKAIVLDNGEPRMVGDSEVLVIYRNNIILIGVDFSYIILDRDFAAIGIPNHALGALESSKIKDPEKLIAKAMSIAAKNNSSVSEEYDLLMEDQL